MQPGADVERAYALGRVYLVAGNGHHVRAEALDCEGDLEKALHRVAVEQDLWGRLFERASKAGMSFTAPVSLFTSMRETSTVSGLSASSTAWTGTAPLES